MFFDARICMAIELAGLWYCVDVWCESKCLSRIQQSYLFSSLPSGATCEDGCLVLPFVQIKCDMLYYQDWTSANVNNLSALRRLLCEIFVVSWCLLIYFVLAIKYFSWFLIAYSPYCDFGFAYIFCFSIQFTFPHLNRNLHRKEMFHLKNLNNRKFKKKRGHIFIFILVHVKVNNWQVQSFTFGWPLQSPGFKCISRSCFVRIKIIKHSWNEIS